MKLVLDVIVSSEKMAEFNIIIQSVKECDESKINTESKLFNETLETISIHALNYYYTRVVYKDLGTIFFRTKRLFL